MDMVDMLDEAGTDHLVADDIAHAYLNAGVYIYINRKDILFLCLYSKVVLTLGSVVAAGFYLGLALFICDILLLLGLGLRLRALLLRFLWKVSCLQSAHLAGSLAERLVAFFEKGFEIGVGLLQLIYGSIEPRFHGLDGLIEIGDSRIRYLQLVLQYFDHHILSHSIKIRIIYGKSKGFAIYFIDNEMFILSP